jgi:hypothetical protein
MSKIKDKSMEEKEDYSLTIGEQNQGRRYPMVQCVGQR